MNQPPNPEAICLKMSKVPTKTYAYMLNSDLSVFFYIRLQPERINCVPQPTHKS